MKVIYTLVMRLIKKQIYKFIYKWNTGKQWRPARVRMTVFQGYDWRIFQLRYNWFYTDTTRASIYYNSAKTPLQPTWINQSTAYVEESNWWAHLSNEAPESNQSNHVHHVSAQEEIHQSTHLIRKGHTKTIYQITCSLFWPKMKSINQPT